MLPGLKNLAVFVYFGKDLSFTLLGSYYDTAVEHTLFLEAKYKAIIVSILAT